MIEIKGGEGLIEVNAFGKTIARLGRHIIGPETETKKARGKEATLLSLDAPTDEITVVNSGHTLKAAIDDSAEEHLHDSTAKNEDLKEYEKEPEEPEDLEEEAEAEPSETDEEKLSHEMKPHEIKEMVDLEKGRKQVLHLFDPLQKNYHPDAGLKSEGTAYIYHGPDGTVVMLTALGIVLLVGIAIHRRRRSAVCSAESWQILVDFTLTCAVAVGVVAGETVLAVRWALQHPSPQRWLGASFHEGQVAALFVAKRVIEALALLVGVGSESTAAHGSDSDSALPVLGHEAE